MATDPAFFVCLQEVVVGQGGGGGGGGGGARRGAGGMSGRERALAAGLLTQDDDAEEGGAKDKVEQGAGGKPKNGVKRKKPKAKPKGVALSHLQEEEDEDG